jgi:hypothetical protein
MLEAYLSPPDVTSSQHDGHFDIEVSNPLDLGGYLGGPFGIDASTIRLGQSFPTKLQHDASILDNPHSRLLLPVDPFEKVGGWLATDLESRKPPYHNVFT